MRFRSARGERLVKQIVVLSLITFSAYGHDVITTKVTFDREIIRLFNSHCISCHRSGGQAFSLASYAEARPWAKAIGEEVLRRRMPPWGAVKGFGDFRDDQGLTPEQLELIVDWEEGGAPEGEPKDIPPENDKSESSIFVRPAHTMVIAGDTRVTSHFVLGALWPEVIPKGASFQIVAELPDGSVYPLIWLNNYKMKFNHPFILRTPVTFPAGTLLRSVPQIDAKIDLIPATDVPPPVKRTARPLSQESHSE
jgi:hypothetical protein